MHEFSNSVGLLGCSHDMVMHFSDEEIIQLKSAYSMAASTFAFFNTVWKV